jgi:hypothetical protein
LSWFQLLPGIIQKHHSALGFSSSSVAQPITGHGSPGFCSRRAAYAHANSLMHLINKDHSES